MPQRVSQLKRTNKKDFPTFLSYDRDKKKEKLKQRRCTIEKTPFVHFYTIERRMFILNT